MEKKNKKKISGSLIAKIIAFILLTVSAFGVASGGVLTIYLVENDYYNRRDFSELFLDESYFLLWDAANQVKDYLAVQEMDNARRVCAGRNFDIALLESSDGGVQDRNNVIWTTYNGSYETDLIQDYNLIFWDERSGYLFSIDGHRIYSNTNCLFRVYVDPAFPEDDNLRGIFVTSFILWQLKNWSLWILGVSVFVLLNSFLFLMYSAGHRNDAEGIQPSVFTNIPLDLYSGIYGAGAVFLLLLVDNFSYDIFDSIFGIGLFAAVAAALTLWCTFYLRELAVRMKLGRWWRNTIIYYVLRLLKRMIQLFWRGCCILFKSFPLLLNTLICFFGICILEFIGLCLFNMRRGEGVLLWMLEKMILLPAVIYVALMCKRLLAGSRALAQGRQEEIVDTSYMIGDFKECGENLNSIGQGITRAVTERMKSEHLKTELITNVSHDLKTPLTSIINYANLIAEEPSENEKITEYSEVLVRQSGRLKKLLEDLLEASKATTGNIEVDLQPCEVGVILSQALGEYQRRMEEKQLELIVTQPEEPVCIMADGRHLWRVFDNLLNNVCKYAREDSRVYLSVEQKDNRVNIIFRNMSKYALNISAEELQERFVRGDKSRHMEGNGLGLSIARSLTELQNGSMDIVTDGDLFKVSLSFTKL